MTDIVLRVSIAEAQTLVNAVQALAQKIIDQANAQQQAAAQAAMVANGPEAPAPIRGRKSQEVSESA